MPIEVTRLRESDIPGAIDSIQQAFADDPYSNWVYDRSKFSHERNRISLGIRCRWGLRNALFYVAKEPGSERVLGVAMWMPPRSAGSPRTWWEWSEEWRLWWSQLAMNAWYGRAGLNVKRYYIWKRAQAAAQAEIWTDAAGYYFLNIVTVLPSEQGRGVGRALFDEVTRLADREGRRCYLESSRDVPNMAIYEAMGFRFVKEMQCRDEGVPGGANDDGDDDVVCRLFCMVREPRKGGDGGT